MTLRRFRPEQVASIASWLAVAYGALLSVFLIVRLTVGDRSPVLFALHAFSLYAFAPLPLLLVAGIALRRRTPLALSALGALSWCGLWGELFLPRSDSGSISRESTEPLVVLSYNALGYNRQPAGTIDVIRDSAADLVALQELNVESGSLIERELATLYPYRWLEARPAFAGAGILSKHPFTRLDAEALRGSWVSPPMVVSVDVSGVPVTFVRFHAFAGLSRFERREQQARQLAAFARSHRGPLVVAGDLNATDQNSAYQAIADELHDAWRRAGFGFGHTFPGHPTSKDGGSRPTFLGIPAPLWLIRIDYIFHSDHFRTSDARLALYDDGSDHRGVIATLSLDRGAGEL